MATATTAGASATGATRADQVCRRWPTRCCSAGTARRTASLRPRTPTSRAARLAERSRAAGTMTGVPTVLVVDDAPEIVRIVRDYLEHAGLSVLTAANGPDALRMARS